MARLFPHLFLLCALLIASIARADDPVLASLIADGAAASTAQRLTLSSALVAVKTVTRATGWTVRPGDVVPGPRAPAPLRITLYGARTPQGREVLCAVLVKYFPENGGWRAHFRLDDEMPFVRQGDRWVPLVGDEPEIALAMGDLMPNIEGYYSLLRFTGVVGPIAIEAWSVDIDGPTSASPLFPR